jgi:hypothetical protein
LEDVAVKSFGFVFAVGALLILACGCGPNMKTPEGTFEALKKATANEDWGVMYDLQSKDSQKGLDSFSEIPANVAKMGDDKAKESFKKEFGSTPEDFLKLSGRDRWIKLAKGMKETDKTEFKKAKDLSIVECKIDGDKATVKFKGSDGKSGEIKMVKEDGKWKIADM